jgi:hypothetical protein
MIERLKKLSQEFEDRSEIVLDLREESAALSNTFIHNGGGVLSDPQSP